MTENKTDTNDRIPLRIMYGLCAAAIIGGTGAYTYLEHKLATPVAKTAPAPKAISLKPTL